MQKKRGRSCALWLLLLGILGSCLIAGLIFLGINEYRTLPRLVSGFDFGTYQLDGYTFSKQQQTITETWGNPQNFYILFYQRENAEGKVETVRYEEWGYAQYGTQIVYENGVEIDRTEISPAAALDAQYSPRQFIAFMNREQLASLTGLDEWFILPVEKELMQNAELYYASGLMFGLQNDELIYVEAVPFEDENAPAVEMPTETSPAETSPTKTAPSLTPEETANQGTHTYTVNLLKDNEILDEHSTTITITFFEEGCLMGENESANTFTQIAPNQYQEDAEDPILMTFNLDGFSWTLTDSPYETRFVRKD